MWDFWHQGMDAWYRQDYWDAMDRWRIGLAGLEVPSWPTARVSEEGCVEHDNVIKAAPLFLFLAGCLLDAQEYALAEQCCRQGLSLVALSTHTEETHQPQLTVQLIQELWACWQEQPASLSSSSLDHGALAREFLQSWRAKHSEKSRSNNNHYYWYNSIWQRPAFMAPNLPSLPFCPREEHPPWCRILEEHFEDIRNECRPLYSSWYHLHKVGEGSHREGAGSHDGDAVTCGDWREVVLYGAGEDQTVAMVPRTRHLLETHCLADAVSLARQGGGEIILSVLAPHTRIAPHCASTNLRWTAHLGLEIPERSCDSDGGDRVAIRVAETWHTWQEGRVLVFDDSYEHEVRNDSSQVRVVLLLRFWHPRLTQPDTRTTVLQQALAWKNQDKERRFHPPVPPTEANHKS